MTGFRGMQAELERILRLQSAWHYRNTPEMNERGKLVRGEIPGWLRDHESELAAAIGIPPADFFPEGRDGTGRKTRVPWARFGSRERTPSATDGFYVVYLFARDGSAVYLSLNQGTTDFENGEFVRKELKVLESRVARARAVLGRWMATRGDIGLLALGDEGEHALGRGYELGDIAAITYLAGAVPDDEQLLADALDFAGALGDLYRDHASAPLPYEVPELVELEDAADRAAGKRRPPRGAGFRQSKEERDLIEQHAVKVAAAYYAADEWHVKHRGAPYDLELTRPGEKRTVEVKGTTSMGEAVPLTAGEVRHHAKAHPNNALVIVRGIVLDRSTTPPTVSGGVLFEQQPFDIADSALAVISYKYTVPSTMYEPIRGIAADDILTGSDSELSAPAD
jgi:hypothetical protein